MRPTHKKGFATHLWLGTHSQTALATHLRSVTHSPKKTSRPTFGSEPTHEMLFGTHLWATRCEPISPTHRPTRPTFCVCELAVPDPLAGVAAGVVHVRPGAGAAQLDWNAVWKKKKKRTTKSIPTTRTDSVQRPGSHGEREREGMRITTPPLPQSPDSVSLLASPPPLTGVLQGLLEPPVRLERPWVRAPSVAAVVVRILVGHWAVDHLVGMGRGGEGGCTGCPGNNDRLHRVSHRKRDVNCNDQMSSV